VTASTGTLTHPFQYATREFDLGTSLYYYRFRYYDPDMERFLGEDPSTFDGGINFYAYVDADPVDVSDRFGLAGRSRPLPKPNPPQNPIPNAISMDYPAYEHCIGRESWKGCVPKKRGFSVPKPDFQDRFGNGAMSEGPHWPSRFTAIA
jgi:RHS repeat-associated protein